MPVGLACRTSPWKIRSSTFALGFYLCDRVRERSRLIQGSGDMPKSKPKRALADRPVCPECGMNMIAVSGFTNDPDHMAFECLRCGHIKKPNKRSQAAE